MSQHLESAFNDVVMRDMMTNDEEGMFYLFCWEQGLHGFSNAMVDILKSELIFEMLEGMKRDLLKQFGGN
tara:strand:- start:184 stop:393 length:210 start_codon:yes stop_codon:yes gene_type:complete